MFGFFPGLDYWKRATADDTAYGLLQFPEAHREFFKREVLKGIRRRAATSDHLVELSILEGERSDILVFSNWNGRETAVEFAVRDVPRYREVAAVNAALFGVKTGQGVLRGKIRLEGGAVVYCRK
jgi:hypothetical protein